MNGKPRFQSGLSLMEILIALVVIGIGVGVFLKMQKGSGSNLAGNSKMMRAGQIVEKHVEALRIRIARDPSASWPPDTTFTENGLKVQRWIKAAASPKTGDALPRVRKVEITVSWGKYSKDSLDVTTYVSKSF